jgi:hypothetical protein
MNKLLILAALILGFNTFAQDHCGTMHYHELQKSLNPHYENQLNQIELFTQQYIQSGQADADRNLIRIPIVFHVVYRTSQENISDAMVLSQLDVLNEDFRRQNADFPSTPSVFQGVAGDFEIEFCLATRDPQGNPTSGITRTQTTATSFSMNNGVKFTNQGGINAWPTNQYLNVWICNLGNNLLGYAQFPGGTSNTDGVVVLYTSVGRPPHNTFPGPYNRGRTLTHEVGHWLNLRHIWGDQNNCTASDLVADTPVQQSPNYGCKTHPSPSCNNGGDMFMNYMDYGNDNCLKMFTNGQKARSRALFAPGGARASLLNSQGCAGSVDPPPVTSCGDTLRFPLSGTPIIYFDEDQGFIAGTNIYNDRAKADRFSVTSSTQLSGGLFYFGFAQSSNADLPITIKAWNSDGAGGSPGTVLAQTTVPISVISQAINNQSYLAINFPSPVTVNGVFYLGYDVPSANAATISLVTNTAGDANPNTAWEQFSNNAWFPYSDAQSWDISINHAISAILVTPQPSAAFSALPLSICEGQTVTFQANNSAGIENYLWTFPGGNPATSTAISPVVTYLSQGSYGATLSVSNQCFAQAITQNNNNAVNVVAAPPVPSITQQGQNLVSSASNNNQWYLDGGLIPGATGQSFSPDQNGLYTVEVSNGSCSSFSSPFQYLSVGIEAPIAEQINIFPNPASNVIYVDYHNATAYQLELIDMSGKVIHAEKSINDGMHLIDLNACGVSQGVFLIKIFDGNQIITRRIVIMP